MRYRILLPLFIWLYFCMVIPFSLCAQLNISSVNSPYITKIFEYRPAPGQFIDGDAYLASDSNIELSEEKVLAKVSEKLLGKVGFASVSLGAYGGYIVLGFDHPIQNKAGEYDFKVYGNATYANGLFPGSSIGVGGSSEPGIVMVSQDLNKNGLPDDPWYELAGSAYTHPKTIHEYTLTYYKPNPLNANVLWRDNQGNQDSVYRNSFHVQASYYPLWFKEDSLIFKGSRLPDNAKNMADSAGFEDRGKEYWVLWAFDWGYADNHANNREESNFKIDWAVDSIGKSIYLASIDFIKIYTGVNQSVGFTGEVSTEFAGIEDLHPAMGVVSQECSQANSNLHIYPNPCKHNLYVETSLSQKASLFSIFGQKVKQIQLQEGLNVIDLQNLQAGFYILKTEQEKIKILLLGK